MAGKLAFVIRDFVHTDKGLVLSPPVTLCFKRSLALEIAESERAEVEGVAMYEIDLDTPSNGPIRPIIVHGDFPERFREMTRRRLLAGTEAAAEHSLVRTRRFDQYL